MKKVNLHLVSDSTGETVSSVARAALSQFDAVEAEEFVWSLIRTERQVEKILDSVTEHPGIVMYTVVEPAIREKLERGCLKLKVPCIPILSRAISDMSAWLGMEVKAHPGRQHALNEEYFNRVEAINYTLMHDDGHGMFDLEDADIVLVGVSRTSKSPTSVYLAYRGFRTANIPFVSADLLPDELFTISKPLIIGLTIHIDHLLDIRKNRLLSLKQDSTDYVNMEKVKEELASARRIFNQQKWPVIDVTRKSVEETAATVVQWYNRLRK